MAIANSYPKATPKADDLILGTVTPTPGSTQSPVTRNFEIDALADLIVSETDAVTGSGTLNYIPAWTPDGNTLGNSMLFQYPTSNGNFMTQVGRVADVGYPNALETLIYPAFFQCESINTNNIYAGDPASGAGLVRFVGDARFGDNSNLPDTLTILSRVEDKDYNLGTAGQILVANASSQLEWTDIADVAGSVTGTGTTNTIPVWTDGPNGVLGDSLITQTTSPDVVTIGSRFIVSPNSILALEISQGAGKALVTISDNLKVEGTYYDAAGDEGTDGDLLVAKGTPGNMVSRWVDRDFVVSDAIAKLIPFTVTASAGGSSTYSADNNIVEIGWTGGNGTYVLNIPSAATIPYRNIRFVTNSSFPNGASDKVQITAQSGETIDGAAFFEISKQYEGVSLWSNGTEWIVIQAKAH